MSQYQIEIVINSEGLGTALQQIQEAAQQAADRLFAIRVSDQWYLEAADFLGAFFLGDSTCPAWKQAETYLGATRAGRALLGSRRYPFDARQSGGEQ